LKDIIKFEFLKIFTSKLFIYTLVIFTLVNIIILHYTEIASKEEKIPSSAYKSLNEEIKNLSEEEKGELVQKEYERNYSLNIIDNIKNLRNSENPLMVEYAESVKEENKELYEKYINEYENANYKYTGDIAKELSFFEEIKKEYDENKNYSQKIDEILEKAENLETISIFKESKDDFSSKNIKDTAKNYEKMKNTTLNFVPSKGIASFTKMQVTDIFIILIIFVISTIIIYEEREKNLLTLIKSTKNGRTKTITSKIIVTMISIIIISLSLYAINFIYYGIHIGYGNLSYSLQSLNPFSYSTLQINIMQYLILFIITKIAVFFAISLIILLISSIAKNNVSSYITFIAIFGISFVLYKTIDPISKYNIFRVINIINLIDTNKIYENYMNLQIFGFMENVLVLSIYSVIILVVTLSLSNILIFNKKKDLQIRESYILRKIKQINIYKARIFSKVFTAEVYKLFITNKVLIILILFAILQIYNYKTTNKAISFNESIYRNYMQILSGKLTEEKEKFIQSEQKRFEEAELAIEKIEERVAKGEISKKDAIYYEEPYENILATKEIFMKILDQYEYIKENPKAEFVYDTGYKELLRINKNAFLQSDIYLEVVSIMCFAGIIVMEYKTGIIKILNSTPKGKKYTVINKIISCIFAGIIIFTISIIPEIMKIKEVYGFDNIKASIVSISLFNNLPQGINILQFIIISYLFRFMVFTSIILLILWISLKIKNTTYSMLALSTLLLVPVILIQFGLEFANYVSINRFLNLSKIILLDKNLHLIYIAIPIIIGIYSFYKLCNKFE